MIRYDVDLRRSSDGYFHHLLIGSQASPAPCYDPMPDDKDVEIAVLRHQLAVIRRQVARPRFSPTDRALLATLSRLVPRERWGSFLVTPATLLRWHRELVGRHWTFAHTGTKHNALDDEIVELIVRLARENPR